MGTRCQVRVKSEGLGWEENSWLYHHYDGYPENMVPIIHEAQLVVHNNFVVNQYDPETKLGMKSSNSYMNGRAKKVSSFLCTVDPTGFEPEDVGDLHGDIEYLYKLFLVNQNGGTLGSKPVWEMEIYKGYGDDMSTLVPRSEIGQIARKYNDE